MISGSLDDAAGGGGCEGLGRGGVGGDIADQRKQKKKIIMLQCLGRSRGVMITGSPDGAAGCGLGAGTSEGHGLWPL